MTTSEKRKHEQTVRKLALRITNLNVKLRSAESRGLNEAHRVRAGAIPVIKGMRAEVERVKAIHADFVTVAESLEGVGYDTLIAFGRALGRGFWGRLAWGVRFVVRGRAR